MSVVLPGQEFHGAFAHAFVSIAPVEPMVVQVKAKQIQITVADMVAKKEVVTQAAVEVLYQGTGTRYVRHSL